MPSLSRSSPRLFCIATAHDAHNLTPGAFANESTRISPGASRSRASCTTRIAAHQHTLIAMGRTLRDSKIMASMGSKGDPWDNASAESCISTIKNELVKRGAPSSPATRRGSRSSATSRASTDESQGLAGVTGRLLACDRCGGAGDRELRRRHVGLCPVAVLVASADFTMRAPCCGARTLPHGWLPVADETSVGAFGLAGEVEVALVLLA